MKKLIMTAAVLAMTLSLGTTAFAASPSATQAGSVSTNCAFVDANNDGICDNLDIHCKYVDADGDGICDNRDTHCTSFVDANNDGVCDNCNTHCTSFVDANNDGVCDNCKNLYTHNNASYSNGCRTGTLSGSGHGSDFRGSGHHGRNHR